MRVGIQILGLIMLILIYSNFYECRSLSIDNVSPEMEGKVIDDYIKDLPNGKVIYNPPQEMIVNITQDINASVTKKNISIGTTIKVAPRMEAHLEGSAFSIIEKAEPKQFVASTGFTTWKWDVTPRKIGNQPLDLFLYVRIPLPNGEEKRSLVFNKTISVKVNLIEQQTILQSQIMKLLTGVLILLGYILWYFRERILSWIDKQGGVWDATKFLIRSLKERILKRK